MNDEVILRLLGIIEKLLDENKLLRSKPINITPTMPMTYPTITTPYKIPITHPSPIVTCETKADDA